VQPQQASSPPAKARRIKTMVRTIACRFFPACNRHAQILAKLLSRSKALKVHGNDEELHDGENGARKKTFEKCHYDREVPSLSGLSEAALTVAAVV